MEGGVGVGVGVVASSRWAGKDANCAGLNGMGSCAAPHTCTPSPHPTLIPPLPFAPTPAPYRPLLPQLMAQEAGLHVDMAGFQAAMEEAKELSRAGQKKGAATGLKFQAEETAYLQNMCGGI